MTLAGARLRPRPLLAPRTSLRIGWLTVMPRFTTMHYGAEFPRLWPETKPMRVVMFYHSLVSDWNHGNAHFLRGVASDLIGRGANVEIYEPIDAWSRENLLRHYGESAIQAFRRAYPMLESRQYRLDELDLDRTLDLADLVLVHEWNNHELVRRIGNHHARRGRYVLLFHDTHHRSVTDPASMSAYDLEHYDGVLAYGEAIREIYLRNGWSRSAWTWHEAADTRVFRPLPAAEMAGDLVWIGNWGDDERTAELDEFLLQPVRHLGLKARIHGVRYPRHALDALAEANIEYGGWLPNYEAPEIFGKYRVTVHVPRRPYAQQLRGIPTIRPFEAMACGIPLVSSPWDDCEGLFAAGRDYLVARNRSEMTGHLRAVVNDRALARELSENGRNTVLRRHTCSHRVDELLSIYREIRSGADRGDNGTGAHTRVPVVNSELPTGIA